MSSRNRLVTVPVKLCNKFLCILFGYISLLRLIKFVWIPSIFILGMSGIFSWSYSANHRNYIIFRPPTLFGVPKEKPLQLVDVEACIDPKNVFSVPEAEAGPPLLERGDDKGKSLEVAPFTVPTTSQEMFMPIVPELKLPELAAGSLYETQHLEPPIENRNKSFAENLIVHEIPSDDEPPAEELAKIVADSPAKEPQKEPDVVSVSVSHENKKSVIRIKVRPSGATSRAEGSARSMERSQGILVRHDRDRIQTSSASVDAPQRNSADAVSISNQNHIEEVNSCHDVGSRMTASIGSVKFVLEGDTVGKELQCTAESGKTSTSQKTDDNQIAGPSFLPPDNSMDNEAQQKYASLQTLSVGKEKEKKKNKEKKEKKRKREDPAYLEKKRLKKEKKQKEKEMAKIMSSSSEPATRKIERMGEAKTEEPSNGAILIKVEPKAEPSSAATETRQLPKFRIKLKSKALNNS